ncbi:hypothetical protein KCU64_g14136, partial [Aureobasidium melanogenum]
MKITTTWARSGLNSLLYYLATSCHNVARPDGPVKPEHTWNTALNTCALTTPNFGYLSTQSRHGDTRDLAPSSGTNHFEPLSGLAKRPVERISELDRNARNEYLREARRHGLSYKEIKCRGDFTEAESTLRGRHRILSKPKEMRVRNPQWNYSDIMLLVKAVGLFSKISRGLGPYMTNSSPRSKVPWKKVAEWMSLHNASYPFASVACAKKWEQIRKDPHKTSPAGIQGERWHC